MTNLKLCLLFTFISGLIMAQTKISGKIFDVDSQPLPGASVVEKGTSNGTTSDFDGNFTLTVKPESILIVSFVGYDTQEIPVEGKTNFTINLQEGLQLDEVVIVGSRSPKRTIVDSAVAIDVIDVNDVATQVGKVEINELLQYAAPSFNASKQSGSDGADHIDPASLRGLGPDQTLVLINGKRRHQSSLINIFGTRGRGNTGTDLNAIPSSSIKRIEVLRDGAAAQYGSDAIAGVINIVLKDDVNKFTGGVTYGAYNTNADVDTSDFGEYGSWNTDGFRLDTKRDGNAIGEDQNFDGGSLKVTANYGFKIGEEGFANFTTEFLNKNKTLRPAFEFRKGYGEAAIQGFNFFGNLAIPVSDKTEFYAFGGRNYRDTDAFAFTRNGGERVVESIYPNGFTPRITSIITDNSFAAGFRTETESGWNVDLSNTYGKNNFHYTIEGTLNASLEDVSPTRFDAGGHSLSQNTLNLDVSKYYEDVLKGMNLAFGAEYRTENFTIFAGEEGSYATYDINGEVVTTSTDSSLFVLDDTGAQRPGGSQGFPGYSPSNVVNENRSNISLYADAEFDITDHFLISAATRFENYSDFGSTVNGKLATRIKASDKINVRASLSTGFRAPSLAQLYYNLQFTNFSAAGATETLLSSNDSAVTQSFGIEALNEEKAYNSSLGFTASLGNFTATIDGYYINIRDRIVLTGYFDAADVEGVDEAQFFVNGANTSTTGLDVVLAWKKSFRENSTLAVNFLANFNNMKVDDVLNGDLDEQTFFGERDKAFLLASAPKSKMNLNFNYNIKKFSTSLSFTRFSEVELLDFQVFEDDADFGGFDNKIEAATDTYSAKITTDLNFGFEISESTKLSIGSNNLFNIYPDQQDDWTDGGGYWDSVQMGFGGAYYYAKLNFNF